VSNAGVTRSGVCRLTDPRVPRVTWYSRILRAAILLVAPYRSSEDGIAHGRGKPSGSVTSSRSSDLVVVPLYRATRSAQGLAPAPHAPPTFR